MPKLSKRKQKKLEANGYDLDFLSRVQPQIAIGYLEMVIIQRFISMSSRQTGWSDSG